MSASSYDAALARVLAHEGGYSNEAADPGGPTNFGITIFDAQKYAGEFGWIAGRRVTAADVKGMPLDFAKRVYRAKYWDAQRCDELPAGVDYAVFDYGVNSGIGRSGKVLRRVLGLPDNDWHTSDAVLSALARWDVRQVIDAICDERLRFLQSLRTWSVFGKGWGARVAEVRAFALQLASGAAATPSTPVAARGGKGMVPVAQRAQQGSAGAVVVGGAVAAQQAHQAGANSGTLTFIIAVATGLAIGTYAFWHWRQARQQDKPA